MIHYPEMPARIMRSLSIIHFSEGSSNWIMRQRNIGIIHYPEGIMNNRNNGYFGALFIIHFFYTQNEPPPPPPHTHHHHHHHHPKTNSTPLFGIPHPRSVSNITIRIRSVLSVSCPDPNSPADPPQQQSVHARPEGFSSQQPICPGLVAGLTPQPACGGQTAAAGAQSHLRRQGLLRLPPPPPSPASSACPSPFMHNE